MNAELEKDSIHSKIRLLFIAKMFVEVVFGNGLWRLKGRALARRVYFICSFQERAASPELINRKEVV